jgi:phytanoyl-CoA hydroxylase
MLPTYTQTGYHVARDLIDPDLFDRLSREGALICRGDRGVIPGLTPEMRSLTDEETFRRILAIHFPHHLSALYTDFLGHPAIVDILTHLIGPHVKCMQSILFIKPPGMPGQAWHQDEIPIPTQDRSLTGVWVALDDATIENGCLWVIPGSHGPGRLYERQPHNDPRYDGTPQAAGVPYTEEDAIPVEIEKGSVLFFNGYLLHRSLPNRTTNQWRRTLVMHYMSAESILTWGGMKDYRDVVLVAGQDPYAHKGITHYYRPYLRLPR